MAEEDLQALAEWPGWTVTETVATYAPQPGGWCARVRRVREPGKTYQRFHIAVIDASGVARYTQFATLLGEARRVAEGQVRARHS